MKGRANGKRILPYALATVCLLYVLQAWTPLRLNTDSIVLLSIASSAADGHGFLDHGTKAHFPPGYPFLVVCLGRLGAGHSWGLVGLNALFLFVGFAAGWYLARLHFQFSTEWALLGLLFSATSFVLVKHFTLPLTDIPFFGLTMLLLAFVARAERAESSKSFFAFWACALMFAYMALLVRSVAIALYPSLLWSLGERFRVRRFLGTNRRAIAITGAAAAAVGAGAAAVLLRTKYLQEALLGYSRDGIGHTLRAIVLFRVHEFGELALNAPASKLGRLSFVVWILGTFVAIAALALLPRLRLGFVEVYLAAYACILFVWPYPDTRFWTPVLPLLFMELFWVMHPWTLAGWNKVVAASYAAAYLVVGLAAMAYSTRITFAGRDFPSRYGDGHLRPTYEAFYSEPTDASQVNRPALELLERYSRPAPH